MNHGTITGLTLKSVAVQIAPDNKGATTLVFAGGLAAKNEGLIENCFIEDVNVCADTTNIEVSWLKTHDSLPAIASGGAKSGDWYNHASLKFTGTFCTSWSVNKKMVVYGGGLAGYNSGTIDGCKVTGCDIEAKVINFHLSGDAPASYAQSYAGGVAGYFTFVIVGCSSNGSVYAYLVLHDSGEGTGGGLGYVDPYNPQGMGYAGGVAGAAKTVQGSTSPCDVKVHKEAYAPYYYFLEGGHYDGNKGSISKLIMVSDGSVTKLLRLGAWTVFLTVQASANDFVKSGLLLRLK